MLKVLGWRTASLFVSDGSQAIMAELEKRQEVCGLELNQGKTHIVYCADSNRTLQHDVTEFTFIGYTLG